MRVQNVGVNNYRKQQNFTSVRFVNQEIAEVSKAGVECLLKKMDPSIDPSILWKALRRLVAVDKICSPNDTFQMAIDGYGDAFEIFAHPDRIAQPCSVCKVDAFPIDKLERRLSDTYTLMKSDYIDFIT